MVYYEDEGEKWFDYLEQQKEWNKYDSDKSCKYCQSYNMCSCMIDYKELNAKQRCHNIRRCRKYHRGSKYGRLRIPWVTFYVPRKDKVGTYEYKYI